MCIRTCAFRERIAQAEGKASERPCMCLVRTLKQKGNGGHCHVGSRGRDEIGFCVPCAMGMSRSDWRRTTLVAVCVGWGRTAREQGWKQGDQVGALKSGQERYGSILGGIRDEAKLVGLWMYSKGGVKRIYWWIGCKVRGKKSWLIPDFWSKELEKWKVDVYLLSSQ